MTITNNTLNFKREEQQLLEKIKDLKAKKILDICKALVVATAFVLFAPFIPSRSGRKHIPDDYLEAITPSLIMAVLIYPVCIYYAVNQANQTIFETENALRRLRKKHQKELEANGL